MSVPPFMEEVNSLMFIYRVVEVYWVESKVGTLVGVSGTVAMINAADREVWEPILLIATNWNLKLFPVSDEVRETS